jgi:hypothetical protein
MCIKISSKGGETFLCNISFILKAEVDGCGGKPCKPKLSLTIEELPKFSANAWGGYYLECKYYRCSAPQICSPLNFLQILKVLRTLGICGLYTYFFINLEQRLCSLW